MVQPSETRVRLSAARIALLYLIASTLYILFSDQILLWITRDPEWQAKIQSMKGLAFVTLSAGLLYFLIHLYSQSLKRARAQEHEAAVRLRAEQAKLQSIIDSMGDGVIVVSSDEQLDLANPTAVTMLGAPVIAQPICEWPRYLNMRDDDKRTPLQGQDLPIMRALRGEVVARQTIYLDSADGPRWLTISARPVLGADGGFDGAVAVLRDTTQLMQTHEALRESQRRLLTLLSNLPGMAYRCRNDRNWTMEFVSDGAEALTGYTWPELTSNNPSFADLVHPDDAEMVWDEVQRAVGRREPFQLMYRITTRPGEQRWVWEQGQGAFDDADQLLALEGFICDITALKLAEDQLAESEARFRSLIENASDVITLLDSRGVIVYQSPSAERVLGYGRDAMIGRRGLEFVWEDDRPRVAREFQAALDNPDRVWQVEFRVRHANGTWRHVEAAHKLYASAASEKIIVCNLRDVTERKEAEAEIRRLAAAVEQAAEAVIICEPDGAIQYGNHAMLDLTQYSYDALPDVSIQSLFTAEDEEDDAPLEAFHAALRNGATWQGRLKACRCNGEPFPCDVTLSPVRDEQQRLLHGVVLLRDMTREVRLEAQIRQQQKLEAIGTLAGGIAHDFNNILSAILGYTEMAMLGLAEDPSAVSGDLEQVVKAGQRARDLVRQILTFSRKTEVGRAPVKTDLILAEAAQLLRATLPSNIELETEFDESCGPVLLDPTHLHQVIMNLCINSFQAMHEKGGTLRIESRQVMVDDAMAREYHDLTPGPYVKIAVQDTGHGMDRAVMERIFEPFFTTKSEQEGTGLGLSTAYGLIKEAGGSILVYSEVGRGTTMHVYIPALQVESKPQVAAKTVMGHGRGERVLVVDDEPAIVTVAAKMLERLGYHPVPFTNSHKALDQFRQEPHTFDVVMTDYSMPDMSGLQLAAEIREVRPDMPILLTSGFHEAFQRRDTSELPIDEVVAKPFDYQSLSDAIARVMLHTTPRTVVEPPTPTPTREGAPSRTG